MEPEDVTTVSGGSEVILTEPAETPVMVPERRSRATSAAEIPVEAPPPVEPTPVDPNAGKPYTLSWWRGLQNFECKLCSFKTVSGEAAFYAHWRSKHEKPRPEGGYGLVGPDGQLL